MPAAARAVLFVRVTGARRDTHLAGRHHAAKLRAGGLRRDGYGVRYRRRCAAPTEFPAPGDPATLRKTTRLHSVPAQTGFASQKRTPGSIRALRTLWQAVLGRGVTRRRRLGLTRAAARPRAALQQGQWRSSAGVPAPHLQRRARPGRGVNQAQALAVDGLAAQRRSSAPKGAYRAARTFLARKTCLSRSAAQASCFALGRKTVQRGEFGRKARSGAAERRSHRAATRLCAALPRGP